MAPMRPARRPQSLDGITIFADLSTEARMAIEKRCAWKTFDVGEPILGHLDVSDDVFFIVGGEARASLYSVDGKAVTFTDLATGAIFGEYAAIDGAPRSASIEARTPCTVASMSAGTFRDLLRSEPAIALALMRQMVTRIRALTTRVYEVSALAVGHRIQSEILRLAQSAPASGRDKVIDPAPTHVDIASRTSTHREAVTREFSRLARLGIIERRGRTLVVHDVERLTDLVHDATAE